MHNLSTISAIVSELISVKDFWVGPDQAGTDRIIFHFYFLRPKTWIEQKKIRLKNKFLILKDNFHSFPILINPNIYLQT